MSETTDCEPITLEELDEQMTGLIKRAMESKLSLIQILTELESAKMSFTIMLLRRANELKIGMKQKLLTTEQLKVLMRKATLWRLNIYQLPLI